MSKWDNWEHFRELAEDGKMMMGNYTAGSWGYIGSQGVLQGTYETLAAVAKVNVVHHQKLALERGVEATPAFEVYADGECQERVRGQVEKDELVELVGEYTAF